MHSCDQTADRVLNPASVEAPFSSLVTATVIPTTRALAVPPTALYPHFCHCIGRTYMYILYAHTVCTIGNNARHASSLHTRHKPPYTTTAGPGRSPRSPTIDDLSRLTTLNCTIDEAMRMFPVAATASVR